MRYGNSKLWQQSCDDLGKGKAVIWVLQQARLAEVLGCGPQVGPIADVPYLRRVAVAHQLHHSEKYGGVPWGMFLGPQELEAVGAKEELDRMVAAQTLRSNGGNSA